LACGARPLPESAIPSATTPQLSDAFRVYTEKQHQEKALSMKSARLVRVAAKLVELGFLDFVNQRRQSGHQRLFPDLGGTNKASDWFARHRKRCGVIGRGREKALHSYRATVINPLGRRGVRTEHIKELVGHDHGDITFGVYYGKTPRRELKEIIDRLD
jgi:integrase